MSTPAQHPELNLPLVSIEHTVLLQGGETCFSNTIDVGSELERLAHAQGGTVLSIKGDGFFTSTGAAVLDSSLSASNCHTIKLVTGERRSCYDAVIAHEELLSLVCKAKNNVTSETDRIDLIVGPSFFPKPRNMQPFRLSMGINVDITSFRSFDLKSLMEFNSALVTLAPLFSSSVFSTETKFRHYPSRASLCAEEIKWRPLYTTIRERASYAENGETERCLHISNIDIPFSKTGLMFVAGTIQLLVALIDAGVNLAVAEKRKPDVSMNTSGPRGPLAVEKADTRADLKSLYDRLGIVPEQFNLPASLAFLIRRLLTAIECLLAGDESGLTLVNESCFKILCYSSPLEKAFGISSRERLNELFTVVSLLGIPPNGLHSISRQGMLELLMRRDSARGFILDYCRAKKITPDELISGCKALCFLEAWEVQAHSRKNPLFGSWDADSWQEYEAISRGEPREETRADVRGRIIRDICNIEPDPLVVADWGGIVGLPEDFYWYDLLCEFSSKDEELFQGYPLNGSRLKTYIQPLPVDTGSKDIPKVILTTIDGTTPPPPGKDATTYWPKNLSVDRYTDWYECFEYQAYLVKELQLARSQEQRLSLFSGAHDVECDRAQTGPSEATDRLLSGCSLRRYKDGGTVVWGDLKPGPDCKLDEILKDLTLVGSLILAYSKRTSLPRDMHIMGDLVMPFSHLQSLPEGLEVSSNSSIYLNDAEQLLEIPEGLKLSGARLILDCSPLISWIPSSLQLSFLSLNSCPGLQEFYMRHPYDFRRMFSYSKGFSLKGWTSLEGLPDDLEIAGDLFLTNCRNIASLPANLFVGGLLDIRSMDRLASLPDGLHAKTLLVPDGLLEDAWRLRTNRQVGRIITESKFEKLDGAEQRAIDPIYDYFYMSGLF